MSRHTRCHPAGKTVGNSRRGSDSRGESVRKRSRSRCGTRAAALIFGALLCLLILSRTQSAYADAALPYRQALDGYEYGVYVGEPIDFPVSASLATGRQAEIALNAPVDGLYEVYLTYENIGGGYLPASIALLIDGETPFEEAGRIVLDSLWADDEQIDRDRFGNEIVGMPHALSGTQTLPVVDSAWLNDSPLLFSLSSGAHTLTVKTEEGSAVLSQVSLRAAAAPAAYEGQDAAGDQMIVLEAENMAYRNKPSIHAAGGYDASLTPCSDQTRKLNYLAGDSFKTAGDAVTYRVTIETAGWYNLALYYQQTTRTDFPVFLDILIDGHLPSQAARRVPFKHSKSYAVGAATVDGEMQTFYFDEGEHLLTLRINNAPLADAYADVRGMLDEINTLSLEIARLSGGISTDRYRDYKILTYLPDLVERLTAWGNLCDDTRERLTAYSDTENCGMLYNLTIAGDQLRRLAEEPQDLPRRMSELSAGTNSVVNYLSEQLQYFADSAISIDKIILYQNGQSFAAHADPLSGLTSGVNRFVNSFSAKDYVAGTGNQAHVQVWMSRGREYVETLQNMIDTEFTPKTGIAVDLSIMPGEDKLILAYAGGDVPDAALSINWTRPSDLAIRGALYDLAQFDDFLSVAKQYASPMFTPYIYNDGVYALPDTVYFCVMFYRTDIFEQLNIPVPETWEDLKAILPELQRRGMNFFYPTAEQGGYKYASGTLPLVWQYGGSVYGETVGDTLLDSEEALNGLRELTELFTVYNIPFDISSGFFQMFREGQLPIGISSVGMYVKLVNAASELDGRWDVALPPGIRQEDGEINRLNAGNLTAMCMFANTDLPEETWEFLKWYSSKETQSEYANRMVFSYGNDYLLPVANLEAFMELPVKASHKEVIAKQMTTLTDMPGIIGRYMVEREISNLVMSVVNNGKDLREALDDAIKNINLETYRKLDEFGYMKDGVMVKEYKTPTLDYIDKLMEAREQEAPQ